MASKIEPFIAHARSKGMDHQTIRMLLLSSGWKEKDIASALASGTLEMSVPVPPDTGSAKDAFFHLLTFTTLYSTVISLVILAFEYIGRLFPDPAMTDYQYSYAADVSGIRWSIAVIVVSYPLFVLLSRILHREFRVQPEKLASGVRKWLTYLTLFVTACTLLGDGITLLFYLLNGELSTRFLLKVFAILVLSGLPFLYYFQVLRMDAEHYAGSTIHSRFLTISGIITGLAVVYGIVLAGTPMQGRAERFDELRVTDLRAIHSEILNEVYGQNRPYPGSPVTALPKPLPKTLQEIADNAVYQQIRTVDPETGESYEYSTKGSAYDLCAQFSLATDRKYDIFWNHPAGRHCYSFDGLDPVSK